MTFHPDKNQASRDFKTLLGKGFQFLKTSSKQTKKRTKKQVERKMLKRFLLFAGEDYYPLAGWNTFIDSYNSLDDAMSGIVKIDFREYTINGDSYNWFEVVDLVEGVPVEQGGDPYGGLWNSEEWKNRKETEEWEKNNE